MCGPNPDEPWECGDCIGKLHKNPNARLCKACYKFGKINADSIIRNTWVWGRDLEPYADEIKREFLKGLEKHKPITAIFQQRYVMSHRNSDNISVLNKLAQF